MESEYDQKSKQGWQSFSLKYFQHQNNMSVFCLTLLNMLKAGQAKKILDAGCGGGYLHPYLISKKSIETQLYAMDFAENMVLISAARVKKYLEQEELGSLDVIDDLGTVNINDETFKQVNYNLSVGSIENLAQFQENFFDVYFSNLVFHLVGNQNKAFSEAFRVLQPGGRFGISISPKQNQCTCSTVLIDVLIHLGIIAKSEDLSQINDKQQLIQNAIQSGFKDILCWEQETAFPPLQYDEILNFLNPYCKAKLEKASTEQKEQIKHLVLQKLQEKQLRNEPLMISCLLLTARKPG